MMLMRHSIKVSRLTRTTLISLLALCFHAPWLWAQTNQGRISLDVGVDFTTDYYFRGIIQETDDSIIQPYAEIGFKLYEGPAGSGLDSISGTLGIWNSFHGGDTGADGSGTTDPKFWYESDLYAGIAVGFAKRFELGLTYTLYTSPNGSFNDVGEWSIGLSFDDSDLLGPFSLSPSATLAFEVDGSAFGPDKGTYLQLGVEPGATLLENPQVSVGVSVPLTLGLSLDDYYEDANGNDDGFGYFDAGVAVNLGFGGIPKSFGELSVTVAGHFLFLGDNLEEANNGDGFKAIGSIGVSLSY
jgi:hypothetical protein